MRILLTIAALGCVGVLALFVVGLYRSVPMLSQDWRVVISGNPDSWQSSNGHIVAVWLVKRFRFAKLEYTTIGNENRIRVGAVAVDAPDFDERMVELKFKADEMRSRLRAIV